MRELYRKSTVHPSPPPPPSSSISDHLALLPAAIFTLTAALTPEDKEVLAYLLSCSNANSSLSCKRDQKQQSHHRPKGDAFSDHCAAFSCSCFRCYMRYWIRWDASPNRQLIHEIIDAFEDGLEKKSDRGSGKKSRRRRGKTSGCNALTRSELTESDSVKEAQTGVVAGDNDGVNGGEDDENGGYSDDGLEFDKGSMKKFVSFIGGRIWGVFGGKENAGK